MYIYTHTDTHACIHNTKNIVLAGAHHKNLDIFRGLLMKILRKKNFFGDTINLFYERYMLHLI